MMYNEFKIFMKIVT